jgi:hypothetical protein
MGALCAVSPGRAHANLTITPTFDSSVTSDPNAAAIEGTIDSAITDLESHISTPINVSVYFEENTNINALSGNETAQAYLSYYDYYNALKAVDTAPGASSAQNTAFASLGAAPTGESSGNPVNGVNLMEITGPQMRALGLNLLTSSNVAPNGQSYDSIIPFNPTQTFPANPNNGSNYSLKSAMLHELDEALGIGGDGSLLSVTDFNLGEGPGAPGPVGSMDLYRYSAPGVRSFSLYRTNSPYAYFSINGGTTVLSYFNQNGGGETEDYGDWLSYPSYPPGYGPQVQDAYTPSGVDPTLGVNELTALEAIGYTLAVPEPTTMGIALCGIVPVLLRRKRAARTAG